MIATKVRGRGSCRTGLAERAVADIRTGRFERSMAALAAAGALVTAAEIFTEHDSASFGNKMMWWPVVVVPTVVPAGVAAVFSRRAARTVLPVMSALVVANGVQGTYLHARGILQKPGGRSNLRYNMEMGPPLFAPMLAAMVGGMGDPGIVAAPRRTAVSDPKNGNHTASEAGATTPGTRGRFDGFDVLGEVSHWDPVTAGAVLSRLAPDRQLSFFTVEEEPTVRRLARSTPGPTRRTEGPGHRVDRPAPVSARDRWLAL